MFNSYTYGKLDVREVAVKLKEFYDRTKGFDTLFQLTVGTDSQTFSKETKIVTVIAAHREGHGGIFFYKTEMEDRLTDVRRKLTEETTRSLAVAMTLTEELERSDIFKELRDNSLLSIHIDAGWSDRGKTKELIPSLVGWIKACGYDCEVKPDSYAASTVADKISK